MQNVRKSLAFQRVHLYRSVQHSLVHECETLAVDEALLQDQAVAAKC